MSFEGDPYRVLGLARGASLAEVKRAYRLLVKQYHPDSAGERALPRFLAIQAAYESLVHGRAAPPRRPARSETPAWEADPTRARATREAYRRRSAGQSAGRDARTDKGADRRDSGSARPGTDAAGGGASWTRTPPGAAPGGERSRRRPGRKATLGSTSYDDARAPFEATWEGGTWYGASSGTYWTINPKEYADPRKHGPEYLARARRARRGGRPDEPPTGEPTTGEPTTREPTTDEPTTARSPTDRPPTMPPPGADAFADGTAGTGPSVPPAGAGSAARAEMPAAGPDELAGGAGFAPGGRVVLALVGWPPIGLAIVALVGELSGCGRFAAACGADTVGTFGAATWLVQLAVVAVLLALPRLARVAAAGSIGLLAASIPVAVFLSAIGGARDPATASILLVALLAAAWLVGVVVQVVSGQPTRSAFGRRVG